VLPHTALRGSDRVLVVDGESRIHYRDVEVLRSERDEFVVGAGLNADEDVVVSPLAVVVDGMKVRITREEPDQASLADSADARFAPGHTLARSRP